MMNLKLLSILSILVLFILGACSTPPSHKKQPLDSEDTLPRSLSKNTQTLENASESPSESQGYASWYGRRFHQRRTASGERFNMYALTAAHRTLPFGSKIRVKNLRSGKSVIVRVNDRGPYRSSRILDLSYGAGKALGLVSTGTAPVSIQVLQKAL